MSLLTQTPPVSVVLGGVETPIHADFRVMLKIHELAGLETDEAARGVHTLELFYGEIPAQIEEATDQLLWFLRCGAPDAPAAGGRPHKPDFSFSHDAPLIYAAFLDQYGVDLVGIPFLHWWVFHALLNGLRDGHRFLEVRRCRAMDLGKVKDKAQRQYYQQMKKLYALPEPEPERAQRDALTRALLNGGDLRAFLPQA